MTYQYIMFGPYLALKHWAFRDKYSFDEYIERSKKYIKSFFLTGTQKTENEKN